MKRNFDNKLTDIKKAEQDRRTELAMLGLLIEKYPRDTRQKLRKSEAEITGQSCNAKIQDLDAFVSNP